MKKAKRILSKILSLLFWSAAIIIPMAVLISAAGENGQSPLNQLFVNIDDTEGIQFVNRSDIEKLMGPDGFQGIQEAGYKKMDIADLEQRLLAGPYIKKADVYVDINRNLHINIIQRKPILRIINKEHVSYYLDENGVPMPSSSNFTARVPVATGHINAFGPELSFQDSLMLNQLLELGRFIWQDPFWLAQCGQIYVNKEGEFELTPRLGGHSILIGNATNLEDKFNRLMIFYKEGLQQLGWDQYATINVKFENQIICKKYR